MKRLTAVIQSQAVLLHFTSSWTEKKKKAKQTPTPPPRPSERVCLLGLRILMPSLSVVFDLFKQRKPRLLYRSDVLVFDSTAEVAKLFHTLIRDVSTLSRFIMANLQTPDRPTEHFLSADGEVFSSKMIDVRAVTNFKSFRTLFLNFNQLF